MCGVHGVGRRYLVEHSAGSGKSNSIAWLAHQLVRVMRPDEAGKDKVVFDSIIVVTDRRILDKQIRDTIKQFAQVSATVGHAESSTELREMIEAGKKIIITTIQKFPLIVNEIGDKHRESTFAIIIDEAHSSQGGKTATALSKALKKGTDPDADDGSGIGDDDEIQDLVNKAIASRKMLTNASYFAFTATPKNKTLEMFGDRFEEGDQVKHRPFHTYTMKQAIDERFILDVLKSYTPVNSYYRLVKTIDTDPEVRRETGHQETPRLRRRQRDRHREEGRDHRRPLPRAGDRTWQDRRPGSGHGCHWEHPPGDLVLPSHSVIP